MVFADLCVVVIENVFPELFTKCFTKLNHRYRVTVEYFSLCDIPLVVLDDLIHFIEANNCVERYRRLHNVCRSHIKLEHF